jgi:pyruvate dehydrogenase E2 component (dihydrolipoamide acetyltransferase)
VEERVGAQELQITFSTDDVSVTEGMVVRWHKHEGDHVDAGEVIVEITTDKVDVDVWTRPALVPSPAEGVLSRILVRPGQTVLVGVILADLIVRANLLAASAVAAVSRRSDRAKVVVHHSPSGQRNLPD